MNLSFLPREIYAAVRNLNVNKLSEIRLREGQPVMAEYCGEYIYLGLGGVCTREGAVVCRDVAGTLNRAMGGCVYSHAEELKEGFVTVEGGVRIGIAGEYITENGRVRTIARPSSLNIRIPHDVEGCSEVICRTLFAGGLKSVLVFSRPGCGKTTVLRDLARQVSRMFRTNVLVLDVRNEIGGAGGYDLGETVDVVRSGDKLAALESAVRAMKPDVIITDELYGPADADAVKFAKDCGMHIMASSHVCQREYLASMPFDCYVKLVAIGSEPEIYDKDFNIVCNNSTYDVCGGTAFGR